MRGRLTVPGDKSISHRYAMLAALADGVSTLTNYAPGADCQSTLSCLRTLGVHLECPATGRVVITGRGLDIAVSASVRRPDSVLQCAGFYELQAGLIERIEETWMVPGEGTFDLSTVGPRA